MRLTIDPEFKEALLNLPQKEKDKYFLRLLKKDHILFHRLQFELTSNQTQDELRKALEEKIKNRIRNSNLRNAHTIRKMMRYVSGDITYHVKITTDKFGEPYLNTVMILETLKRYNEKLNANIHQSHKLNQYIIARIFKILALVYKLHEDDQFEFETLFNQLAELIEANKALWNMSIQANLDVNWLHENNIPENVHEIAKEARNQGVI